MKNLGDPVSTWAQALCHHMTHGLPKGAYAPFGGGFALLIVDLASMHSNKRGSLVKKGTSGHDRLNPEGPGTPKHGLIIRGNRYSSWIPWATGNAH